MDPANPVAGCAAGDGAGANVKIPILRLIARCVALLVCVLPLSALSHTSSTAYLSVEAAQDATPLLNWRIALRDLDALLDLDADADGRLTWGEVEDRSEDIVEVAVRSLTVRRGEAACSIDFQKPRFARLDGTGYAMLSGGADCVGSVSALRLDYLLFLGIDPSHRVLLSTPESTQPIILAPGAGRVISVPAAGNGPLADGPGTLYVQGVTHILGGFDHLLFLVALLLPTVLIRQGKRWVARSALRPALIQVAAVVTAFTVAHSITLGLASFGWVRIPSSIVEPLIAVTILLAALNNLHPVLDRQVAWAAFAFGLVHGFGFAEVLAPLELPVADLALALAAFNLGVQSGQLLVVAGLIAPLAAARGWKHYPRWVLGTGSIILALIACGWMVERLFDVPVFALG
jgi:HupE / UreJ protein